MPLNPMVLMPPQMQAIYAQDPRVVMANEQMRNGTSTAPVRTPIEGLARALGGVAGQYQMARAGEDYGNAGREYNEATARIFSQPDLVSMNTVAAEEAKKSPLLAPLAQQLAILNVEKGGDIEEKQMQLRIMKALLGDNLPGGAPGGAPQPAVAPGTPAGVSPPLDTSGVNAPMPVPGAGGNAAPATPAGANTDLQTRILNDPNTRMMASIAMPKIVDAVDKSPAGIKANKTAEYDAEFDKQKRTNTEGAQGFLSKIDAVEALIKDLGDSTGRVQGTGVYQTGASILDPATQNKRDRLQAMLSDLELDVAKMKLKGQGAVSNMEREIAKSTLPRLNLNQGANLAIIKDLRSQAGNILNGASQTQTSDPYGGAKPSLDSFWSQ